MRSSDTSSRSSRRRRSPISMRRWTIEVGDDLLRLVFISCHPILSPEARAALTLRLLGGLTSDEIARAFLVPEPTIQQRIVRAKRTLSEKRVPFEVPRGDELEARLSSVLSVIYLIFNEGYSATAGEDWMRPQLCQEALRLGRILAELAPRGARGARPRRADGDPGVALRRAHRADRESRCCCSTRIGRAGTSSSSAAVLPRSAGRRRLNAASARDPGPYALQAAIAACHARARSAEETDWAHIVGTLRASSARSRRRRSSNSIARWRSRCCSVRRRGSIWSMR